MWEEWHHFTVLQIPLMSDWIPSVSTINLLGSVVLIEICKENPTSLKYVVGKGKSF